jgi:hypothetical protein
MHILSNIYKTTAMHLQRKVWITFYFLTFKKYIEKNNFIKKIIVKYF